MHILCLCVYVWIWMNMDLDVHVCAEEKARAHELITFNVKRIKIYMLKCLVLHFNRLVNAYAYMGIDAHFFIHN